MTLQPEYSLGGKYKFSLRRIGITKPTMKVVAIDQFSMAEIIASSPSVILTLGDKERQHTPRVSVTEKTHSRLRSRKVLSLCP